MTREDPRHGSEAGHEQHLRDGELSCPACYHADLLAARRRSKRRALGHRYMVPLGRIPAALRGLHASGLSWRELARASGLSDQQVREFAAAPPEHAVYVRTARKLTALAVIRGATPAGVTRRLRALTALGWTTVQIEAVSGLNKKTIRALLDTQAAYLRPGTAEGVLTAYAALSMKIPVASDAGEQRGISRARNLALRAGWPPPFGWDCDEIDDPKARPRIGEPASAEPARIHRFDPAAVQGRLAGYHDAVLTRAERLAVVRHLHAKGLNDDQIALTSRFNERQVMRDRQALGLRPNAPTPTRRTAA